MQKNKARANTASGAAPRRPHTAASAAKAQNDAFVKKLTKDTEYEETRQTFKRCNDIGSDIAHMTKNKSYKAQV